MREVFRTVADCLATGRKFALATLVELRDAKTAPLGTTIAVDADGGILGNIGAGCYEGEIIEAAMKTLVDGEHRRVDINLDTDDVLAGGTSCGAVLRLITWRPDMGFLDTAAQIARGEHEVRFAIDEYELSFEAKTPLILVGATSLAADIAAIASRADFYVVVVDPRGVFATSERIPDADEIIRQWPDEYLLDTITDQTSIVVLSHDPKFDLPALRVALKSRAPYIGLLGSRRAQASRRLALSEDGFDAPALARIHGPAGLDIGGKTTAETAISIVAEIIARRSGRRGAPLLVLEGAIH